MGSIFKIWRLTSYKWPLLFLAVIIFGIPTIVSANSLTQTDFSAGPKPGSAIIPANPGSYAFSAGFESASNISYADGKLALADPTRDGEFVSSPLDIRAIAGTGSVYPYDLSTHFEDDYPPGSNINPDISVYYRVDGGSWKEAEWSEGQGVYQLFHQICTPMPIGYPSCAPDGASYSYAGSTLQYKLVWKGGNPPRTALSKIHTIGSTIVKSTKKVAAATTASTAQVTKSVTTTVVDPPTLVRINEFAVADNPVIKFRQNEQIIFAGRSYSNASVRLFFSDTQYFDVATNNLGNWVHGFASLPAGDYTLSGQATSSDGHPSEKKELYKFSVSAVTPPISAAPTASSNTPQASSRSYYLASAGLLVLILLVLPLVFRRRIMPAAKLSLQRLAAFEIWRLRPSRIVGWAFVLVLLVATSLVSYLYLTAGYCRQLADSAFERGNFSLAHEMYQEAARVPVALDKALTERDVEANDKAAVEDNYLAAVKLSQKELSPESCKTILSKLSLLPETDPRHAKSYEKILQCQLMNVKIAMNELYPDSAGDPRQVRVAVTSSTGSTSLSAGGYATARHSASEMGEHWNGFYLMGTEAWKAKIKEAITHISAISPDRYAAVQKYAQIIHMLPDFVNGEPPQDGPSPYPMGTSSCGSTITMRLNEGTDGNFHPASMERITQVIVHEADHGELTEIKGRETGCSWSLLSQIHQEMWSRWEATFNQQAAAWFASH